MKNNLPRQGVIIALTFISHKLFQVDIFDLIGRGGSVSECLGAGNHPSLRKSTELMAQIRTYSVSRILEPKILAHSHSERRY